LPRAAENPILTGVKHVPYVGDILDIEYVVTPIPQVAGDYIKADVGFGMANVGVVIYGWAADIHVDTALSDRHKGDFFSIEDIVDL